MDPGKQTEAQVWTGRPVRPVIALYVAAVFFVFMAMAYFVFDSMEAVKALFLAAIGGIFSLVPSMATRLEYSMTEEGLWKRPLKRSGSSEFEKVFSWDDLSHIVPTRSGFKFYKETESGTPFRRFLRLHVLSGHSGEVHVEGEDRRRVLSEMEARRIPTTRAGARRSIQSTHES